MGAGNIEKYYVKETFSCTVSYIGLHYRLLLHGISSTTERKQTQFFTSAVALVVDEKCTKYPPSLVSRELRVFHSKSLRFLHAKVYVITSKPFIRNARNKINMPQIDHDLAAALIS